MSYYSFRRDLEESKRGVAVASEYFAKEYHASIRDLPKEEQAKGDIEVQPETCFGQVDGQAFFVEVKFDIMAGRTGNLCFEVHNGKKATGILATQADKIVYVIPQPEDNRFKLFIFGRSNLISYISDTANSGKFRLTNGGDKRRFGMVLVPIETIEADGVAEGILYA